ncbi:hypothetical protein GCM10009799_20680 [Nocardiopsis rhodophaea]|uniref:Uncharacterized protein n=1 Tax=Nocardiopsis rhodophaea TaxID=280238 RepID=A0ABN2SXQ2_9ACTN
MPRPLYPSDIGGRIRRLEDRTREAWTAAQSRARFAAIRAASIVIGTATGNQITIDPDSSGAEPRIRFTLPDSAGTARLSATLDGTDPVIALAVYDSADTLRSGIRAGPDGARITAYDTGGAIASYVWAQPDGTVHYLGTLIQD